MTDVLFTVVLDYCGGQGTDRLVENLVGWNPSRAVNVLDNASPRLPSRYVTHKNSTNKNVGGGIQQCIALAERSGASHVLMIMNDIKFCTPLLIDAFEAALAVPNPPAHVSASMSHLSSQARIFPWTATSVSREVREVPHADILCSLIDIGFVSGFGGFPASESGWGYGWELAYHANRQGRAICVLDECVIHHSPEIRTMEQIETRRGEMRAVYRAKYGEIPWLSFRSEIEARHSKPIQ